eukprot:5509794-Pleurochrysis_carterae.AAC.6
MASTRLAVIHDLFECLTPLSARRRGCVRQAGGGAVAPACRRLPTRRRRWAAPPRARGARSPAQARRSHGAAWTASRSAARGSVAAPPQSDCTARAPPPPQPRADALQSLPRRVQKAPTAFLTRSLCCRLAARSSYRLRWEARRRWRRRRRRAAAGAAAACRTRSPRGCSASARRPPRATHAPRARRPRPPRTRLRRRRRRWRARAPAPPRHTRCAPSRGAASLRFCSSAAAASPSSALCGVPVTAAGSGTSAEASGGTRPSICARCSSDQARGRTCVGGELWLLTRSRKSHPIGADSLQHVRLGEEKGGALALVRLRVGVAQLGDGGQQRRAAEPRRLLQHRREGRLRSLADERVAVEAEPSEQSEQRQQRRRAQRRAAKRRAQPVGVPALQLDRHEAARHQLVHAAGAHLGRMAREAEQSAVQPQQRARAVEQRGARDAQQLQLAPRRLGVLKLRAQTRQQRVDARDGAARQRRAAAIGHNTRQRRRRRHALRHAIGVDAIGRRRQLHIVAVPRAAHQVHASR